MLMLIGDGPLKAEVQKKITKLGLDRKVIFTGIRNDVSNLMQALDVFVLPSNYEGLGIVCIEAQAAGLPCIISDKVSKECIKTDLVKQLKLDSNSGEWADAIISASREIRRDTYNEMIMSGYDIRTNAEKLQNFYIALASGKENVCLY